jgi:hypothetical protein
MTEYRDMLITKIDESKDKLNSLVSEINSDLKACVLQFTETINNKIKTLETNFAKQTDELEKLKKDLSDKKFDENNYMNVSITMNLAKQIKERDLRIKELEQRIKYNDESKSSINNESKLEITQENQVTEPIIVPEKKSTKISIKSKTAINDKSTSEPIVEPIVEPISESISEPIVEEKPKKKITIKKQTKAEIAKEEARLAEAETSRLAEEASRISKESSRLAEEAMRFAEEKKAILLAEEEKAIRLAEEEKAIRLAEEEAVRLAEEEEAQRKEAVRLAEEEAQRKEEPKVVAKKKATEKATEKVTEKVTDKATDKASEKSKTKEKSKEKSKEKTNDIPEKVEYPSDIPNIEDVEVLEYKNNDYYMDKLNNVFQMTNEQDIGIFIGVYNKTTKELMYIQN